MIWICLDVTIAMRQDEKEANMDQRLGLMAGEIQCSLRYVSASVKTYIIIANGSPDLLCDLVYEVSGETTSKSALSASENCHLPVLQCLVRTYGHDARPRSISQDVVRGWPLES